MGPPVVTPSGPPAVAQGLGPGLVLLGPTGVEVVHRALAATIRVLRGDGIGPSPQLRELLEVVEAARSAAGTPFHAGRGTSEPPGAGERAACGAQDQLEVREAASMLGISQGYVRRLCRRGAVESAHRDAGRWLLDRVEVDALRDDRAHSRRTA